MSRRQRDLREVASQVADLEEEEANLLFEEAKLEAEMAEYFDVFDFLLEPLDPEPYFDPFPDDVGDDDLSDPLTWFHQVRGSERTSSASRTSSAALKEAS